MCCSSKKRLPNIDKTQNWHKPMIETDYIPLEKEYELVSFDDDEYELSWRQIIGYRYRDERHAVSNWVEMLVQVCKLIYNESPSTMTYVASKNYWVHDSEAKGRSKVAEHCYVHTSCSTNTKHSILNYLFKECGIPTSVLDFELVPLTDKAADFNEE